MNTYVYKYVKTSAQKYLGGVNHGEAIAWRHALALLSSAGVPDAVMQGSRDAFGMVSNWFINLLSHLNSFYIFLGI